MHRSNVEEFRLGLGWRRCYARLALVVPPPLSLGARLYETCRDVLERIVPPGNPWMAKADGLARLVAIARSCRDVG